MALLSLTACATDTGVRARVERFEAFTDDIEVSNGRSLALEEAMAHYGVHGLSVVSIDQGQIGAAAHHGIENTETGKSTDAATVYQAASLSKLVAGLGMARADRTGLMSLDTALTDPVRAGSDRVLIGWHARNFTGRKRFWAEKVTLRRLLQHGAGTDTATTGTSCDIDDTRIEAFLGIDGTPVCSDCVGVKHEPGTRSAYSSGGYVVAEAMFEDGSGRTARDYLEEEVLEPYGLDNSTFRNATSGVARLATACDVPDPLTGDCACTHEVAHVKFPGGLLANPLDYARLLVLIMNDGEDWRGNEVIPISDIEQVLTPGHHVDSSLSACSNDRDCDGGERCVPDRCILPLEKGEPAFWRGLGVNLSSTGLASDGLPAELFHDGGQDGFSTFFNIDRVRRNGVVIFINGPVKALRKALLGDLIEAFKRVYRDADG